MFCFSIFFSLGRVRTLCSLLRSRRKNGYRLWVYSEYTLILFSSLQLKYLKGLCCLLFITSNSFWVPNAPFLRCSSVQGGWFSHYLRGQTWSEKEMISPRPLTSCRHLSRTSCVVLGPLMARSPSPGNPAFWTRALKHRREKNIRAVRKRSTLIRV